MALEIMRVCKNCNQLYSDDTYFFCLNDGHKLEPISETEVTHLLPGQHSVVTVISKRLGSEPGVVSFAGEYVYDEVATDGLALKIISSDEDNVTFGMKITLKNLSVGRREVYVTVEALDSEGFELEEYTLSAKLGSGELKTVTSKQEMETESFGRVSEWRLDEIVSYE